MSTQLLAIATAVLAVIAFLLGRGSTAPTIRTLRDRLVQANYLVHYDTLTQLPNRRLAEHAFDHKLQAREPAVVVLVDLDRFKSVNDEYGHQAGDELLTIVAQRLEAAAISHNGLAARLAGDEFLLILPTFPDRNGERVERILRLLTTPAEITGDAGRVQIRPSACAGLAIFDGTTGTFDSVLREADIALYRAKQRPGTHQTYRPGDHIPRSPRARTPRLREQHSTGEARATDREAGE